MKIKKKKKRAGYRRFGKGPGSFQVGKPEQVRPRGEKAKRKTHMGLPEISKEEGGARSRAQGDSGPLSKHWVISAEEQRDPRWKAERVPGALSPHTLIGPCGPSMSERLKPLEKTPLKVE